jgi:hypothetical protein
MEALKMSALITFCAPPEVTAEIRAAAKAADVPISQLLRDAFTEYQERRREKKAEVAA